MTTATFGSGAVPPMPDRTPKALRAAIAQHAPQLLVDFDRHWRRDIADAYDLAPVPAFMARWWGEFALARDPRLEAKDAEDNRNAPGSVTVPLTPSPVPPPYAPSALMLVGRRRPTARFR